MRIKLSAAEMRHGLEKYIRGKNMSDSPNHEYVVTIHCGGREPYALIDIRPAIPTLHDAVQEIECRPVEGQAAA